MEYIEHSTHRIQGAFLYAPNATMITSLVVWLDGGMGREPHKDSLGKLIANNTISPSCFILMPCSAPGYNLKSMTSDELWFLIDEVKKTHNIKTVSIVGWSNGSDATAQQVAVTPDKFYRVCLISNYTKQWDNCANKITAPVSILLGAREKSAAKNRSWPIVDKLKDCKLYRVEPYDHMIGEGIWTDDNYFVLDWLTGKTDDIMTPPKELIKASKQVKYNENIETKRSI